MKVAAVDIGTNTARLLVAEVMPAALLPPSIEWLDRRTTVTHLGEGVDESGRLAPAAIGRTVAALRDYGDAIRAWQCEAVRAVATSASRDAANREVFFDQAALALGSRPEVIGGAEEAALSFAGTACGLEGVPPILVVDLGGGSTEFVLGTTEPGYVVSVDIGSVRLSERMLPDRPASRDQLRAARAHVDELLLRHVAIPDVPGTVIGVGGTYTSLAAIALDLEVYDAKAVHGTLLDEDTLRSLADQAAMLTVEQTAAIPSLDPARAPVLLGGAVVAERALHHVGSGAILVSENDILDGIALRLATPR